MKRKSTGNTTPYGQSCLHCFKSKCKCIKLSNDNICERCRRLNKQCQPSEPVRKRNVLGNQNANTRISQLENKLDSLTSLLQSIAQSSDPSAALRGKLGQSNVNPPPVHTDIPGIVPTPLTISPASSLDAEPTPTPFTSSEAAGTIRDTGCMSSRPPSSPPSSLGSHRSSAQSELSIDEESNGLNIFRAHMLPNFPFMHFPPSITAPHLRRTRPFLFRAIMTVTIFSRDRRVALGRELKRALAEAMLLENQSSLDLLLGLLVYISWGYDQFLVRSFNSFARLTQLALSLVYDLRLNRPIPKDVQEAHIVLTSGEFNGVYSDSVEGADRWLLEKERAVLGCFVLTSFVQAYYGHVECLRWTPQMEKFLHLIEASTDCPTDRSLALQVRLQLLVQKASQVREQQELSHAALSESGAGTTIPSFLYLKVFHTQLQSIKSTITPEDQSLLSISLHIPYAEVSIYAMAYMFSPEDEEPLATTSYARSSPEFERLECLWRSVEAVKTWIDAVLSIPPVEYTGVSFIVWSQLTRCFAVLFRLSMYDEPGWDRQAVRNKVDMASMLDKIIFNLDEAGRQVGESSEEDLFALLAAKMRKTRAWVATKFASDPEADSSWDNIGQMSVPHDFGSDPDQWMSEALTFGNDVWLEEVFGRL
ncbi:hypothetical protein BX600DRAFT_464559 [Xylariales sp. PMI_506]|nr:hypothetical protein BX600DRAFT_464559 [Xylariales sp. PMI_506]